MQMLEKPAVHKCAVEIIGNVSWQTVHQLASQPAYRLAGWLVGRLFAMIHFRAFPEYTCALRTFQAIAWTWKCTDFNLDVGPDISMLAAWRGGRRPASRPARRLAGRPAETTSQQAEHGQTTSSITPTSKFCGNFVQRTAFP